ncbi:MAG TPA: hypothetical protein VEX86_03570 [Longimicrobium sp.]|nr:hypothetical protein [Longimicrobium sp.]
MGLFDRNDYGRDYHGGGRSLGDRVRGAWNRFESRLGGGPRHGGYDRDVRYTAGGGGDRGGYAQHGGYDAADFAYRGLDGAWSTARNRGAHDSQWDWRAAAGSRYDQDMGPRPGHQPGQQGRQPRYDAGYRAHGGTGYSRDYGARGGYDRDLGDRMRTDAGDPFGDRQSRTPFRVMRGGFDTEQTDRGNGYRGDQFNRLGRDPNDVHNRGWGHGIGDDPVYRPEDFQGRDRGRGRRGPF